MARSIEQCEEKIAELKKEQARYTNDGGFCRWFQIGGHILRVEQRRDIMLGRKRLADRAVLDKPIVLTGDPLIDTLNRIERDRHIAKQNAKHPEHPYIDTNNLAPVDSVPLPAAIVDNVATFEGLDDAPMYDEDGNEL